MARASATLALRRTARALSKRPIVAGVDNDVQRCRDSFYHFCVAMGKPPVEHMLDWHAKLNTGQDSRCLLGVAGNDTAILSPRGSAKSTCLILWVGWNIGRHTLERWFLRVLYVSFIIDISRAKSASIKRLLATPEYQRIFPTVRLDAKKYSDELWAIDFDYAKIDVRGDDAFTLCCSGLKGATVSRRSNLVVLDDLIKSKESIENPAVRNQMASNYTTAIMPTKLEGARTLVLGTRFLWDDIFNTQFTPEKGFDVLQQKAIITCPETGDLRSYWPQFYSLEDLLKRKQANEFDFEYQYQNETPRGGELGTEREWLNYGEVPSSYDLLGVSLDLSSADKEINDWTVILLGGRDGDRYWLIDFRRIKTLGNIEKIAAMKEMLADWDILGRHDDGRYYATDVPCTIWPESVAYQRSFAGDLLHGLRGDDEPLDNLHVSEVKGFRGDKIERFKGVIGLFQRGKVHLNRYRDWSELEGEFLNIGNTAHDDFIDAVTILLTRLSRRQAPQTEFAQGPGELPPEEPGSWGAMARERGWGAA